MKKVIFSLTFIIAVATALVTSAFSKPLATTYYEADPTDVANTCRIIDCNETASQTCTFSAGYSGFKSLQGQSACNTSVTNLKRNP